MKILIDTCILSEVRHPSGNPIVKKALSSHDEENLFLSVLTLGEIAKGIFLLSSSSKKTNLIDWLNGLETQFSDRILPIDRETALMWGEMTARAKTEGRIIPVSDGLIAATALRYGLHVMTCNARHFDGTGAFIIDPNTREKAENK
jgi:predicted nucleic acid-binding protein